MVGAGALEDVEGVETALDEAEPDVPDNKLESESEASPEGAGEGASLHTREKEISYGSPDDALESLVVKSKMTRIPLTGIVRIVTSLNL